ncbi:hypothetical protein IE53DRAFT_75921 [Violaceomyces palustris]|uniref:Uncharacterized protein n=1 Tax=Violaceomyces palustris TaxID=1673888 RepID=A0ACD0NYX6_9BASI|nr:hypothetical protein IE53DRAFT_75921 [Violaceomyces palustris]
MRANGSFPPPPSRSRALRCKPFPDLAKLSTLFNHFCLTVTTPLSSVFTPGSLYPPSRSSRKKVASPSPLPPSSVPPLASVNLGGLLCRPRVVYTE